MKADSFRDFVLDQLGDLESVNYRAMFGGHGLYSEKHFFGIIAEGRLYLKTDESNRTEYDHRGMKPFQPNKRQAMKYHEVPPEVIESRNELVLWARQSVQIARHAR